MLMDKDLPAVAVHDVVIQEREKDLIVGTHGRSIYVADLEEIQALDSEVLAENVYVFPVKTGSLPRSLGKKPNIWVDSYEREKEIPFYSKNAKKVELRIQTESGLVLWSKKLDAQNGLNYPIYNFEIDANQISAYENWLNRNTEKDAPKIELESADNDKFYLQKGTYEIILQSAGDTAKTTWTVE